MHSDSLILCPADPNPRSIQCGACLTGVPRRSGGGRRCLSTGCFGHSRGWRVLTRGHRRRLALGGLTHGRGRRMLGRRAACSLLRRSRLARGLPMRVFADVAVPLPASLIAAVAGCSLDGAAVERVPPDAPGLGPEPASLAAMTLTRLSISVVQGPAVAELTPRQAAEKVFWRVSVSNIDSRTEPGTHDRWALWIRLLLKITPIPSFSAAC
jgi:hypothetical protein